MSAIIKRSVLVLLAVVGLTGAMMSCSAGAAPKPGPNDDDPRPEDFPAAVLVTAETNQFGWVQCGGTLIGERFVITHSHCAFELNRGSVSLRDPRSAKRDQSIGIKESLFDINLGLDRNEIGILLLKEPAKLSKAVRVANLAAAGRAQPAGQALSMVGLGLGSKPTSRRDNKMKDLKVIPMRSQVCEFAAPKPENTIMCAKYGLNFAGEGTCYGDIGSGLYDTSSSKSPILVGVYSHISEAANDSVCSKGIAHFSDIGLLRNSIIEGIEQLKKVHNIR